MPLRAYYSAGEEIPEGLSDYYKENEDGSKILDVETAGDYSLENRRALSNSMSQLKDKLAKKNAILEKYRTGPGPEDFLDPEESRTALERIAEIGDIDESKIEEKFKIQQEDLLRKHKRQLEEHKKREKDLEEQLGVLMIETKALEEIGDRGYPSLLLPVIQRRTRIETGPDGKLRVVTLNEQGLELIGSDGENPDIKGLVKDLYEDERYAPAFKPESGSGSGTPSKGISKNADPSKVSGKESKVIEISASDQEAINANWEAIATGEARVVD